MTTHRNLRPRTNAADFVPAVMLPRGPNGNPLCRWCHRETASRRNTFCGPPCVHAWKLRSDPGYLRGAVFARDKGVCAACGTDTVALAVWIAQHLPVGGGQGGGKLRLALTARVYLVLDRHIALLRVRGYDDGRSLWAADHVIPVAAGGGQCDLGNIQTLCVPCHKAKSRREAAERRAAHAAPQTPLPGPSRATAGPLSVPTPPATPGIPPAPFRVLVPPVRGPAPSRVGIGADRGATPGGGTDRDPAGS